MMSLRQYLIYSASTLMLMSVLGSCTPVYNNRGHVLKPEDIAKIQPGVTTQSDIRTWFGTPSSVNSFDRNVWYYVGGRTQEMAFFKPQLEEQNVLTLTFNDDGTVNKVEQLDQTAALPLKPDSSMTPTAGDDLSILQQLIGNIGRFQGPTEQNQRRE